MKRGAQEKTKYNKLGTIPNTHTFQKVSHFQYLEVMSTNKNEETVEALNNILKAKRISKIAKLKI